MYALDTDMGESINIVYVIQSPQHVYTTNNFLRAHNVRLVSKSNAAY
jgi:hypothetical protein